jgi:predicted O-linked N-acetylglucosamine transferase (SPINDLY family)
VYRELGDLANAIEAYNRALREDPNFAEAHAVLGVLLMMAGNLPQAQAHCEQALLLRPGFAGAHTNLGLTLLKQSKIDQAVLQFEQAIHKDPKYVAARINLGVAYAQLGRIDEALVQYQEAVRLNPSHALANGYLHQALIQHGKITLAELYSLACTTPSDINEHVPTLYTLAQQCRHVTELGTRTGVSTTAFLYAAPEVLVCYDKEPRLHVAGLQSLATRTRFAFHQADVLLVDIEETDLLFIDTWHVYSQLQKELERHAAKAKKHIVLHDTTTFAEHGETNGHRGVWPAIEEFIARGRFRLAARVENNNGLTILQRTA